MISRTRVAALCLAGWLLSLGVGANPALAQQTEEDSLRAQLRLPAPPSSPQTAPAAPEMRRAAPAMGANSPSAYGPAWGDVYFGAAYQARARYASRPHDGVVAAGFGLGNPWTLVGLQVDLISFSTFRSGWGNRAAVDLKLHRVLPGGIGVAVGYESAFLRGVTDSGRNQYAVVSSWRPLRDPALPFSSVMVSVGAGNGRFLSEEDWERDPKRLNVFGSLGLRVLPAVALVADWTGQDLTLGTSVAPLRSHQIVISAGLTDVTGAAGDGVRAVLAGSYRFRFLPR